MSLADEDHYTEQLITLTPTDLEPCVSIILQDDLVLEETEVLMVSLSGQVNSAVQFSLETAIIYVADDDGEIKKEIYIYKWGLGSPSS